jgi:hypothetical protein
MSWIRAPSRSVAGCVVIGQILRFLPKVRRWTLPGSVVTARTFLWRCAIAASDTPRR